MTTARQFLVVHGIAIATCAFMAIGNVLAWVGNHRPQPPVVLVGPRSVTTITSNSKKKMLSGSSTRSVGRCFTSKHLHEELPLYSGDAAAQHQHFREKFLSQQYGCDRRMVQLSESDLPVLAEVYVNGQAMIARIVGISLPTTTSSTDVTGNESSDARTIIEPKLTIETETDASTSPQQRTIDFGQVTTVLPVTVKDFNNSSRIVRKTRIRLSTRFVEQALDRLYRSRVGRGRSTTTTTNKKKQSLSKKDIMGLVVQLYPVAYQAHVERVLRQIIKAGYGLSRLVDAELLQSYLWADQKNSKSSLTDMEQIAWASNILSHDATAGGRFKRWPSVFLDSSTGNNNSVTTIRFLNGGWLVLDQSVRMGSEARKFVDRPLHEWTTADHRIAQRLECMAMGEDLDNTAATNNDRPSSSLSKESSSLVSSLERDVREVLRAMNVPITPSGAREALVRVGRWTETNHARTPNPWSKEVMDAASWYITQRRQPYYDDSRRVDLTSYPCLCIDAERASFRDDAIGLRPRASTGRVVIPEASKWEVLVHVVDTSDIYCCSGGQQQSKTNPNLAQLRDASKSRGTSRYDLPLGPLHLLPPKVLQELSLSRKGSIHHRCVTIWAYIDERDGRLLDFGLERTLVQSPILLSFAEATNLMDQTGPDDLQVDQAKYRILLFALERSLNRWKREQILLNDATQRREDRLARRELEGADLAAIGLMVDDGRDGFWRSRSHRLVDAALDLYSHGVRSLLRNGSAPVPEARGADASRGGRVATAPLRRYVDGEAQRQALAVACNIGRVLSAAECREIGKTANLARNSISNVRATRR